MSDKSTDDTQRLKAQGYRWTVCPDCGVERLARDRVDPCPECGGGPIEWADCSLRTDT